MHLHTVLELWFFFSFFSFQNFLFVLVFLVIFQFHDLQSHQKICRANKKGRK